MHELLLVLNLPGKLFYLLYAILIFVCYLALLLWFVWMRKEVPRPLPPIPEEPDPVKMAYIRGKEYDLLQTGMYAAFEVLLMKLFVRGYLHLHPKGILAASNGPSPRHLDKPLRQLYNCLDKGKVKLPRTLFGSSKVQKLMSSVCHKYEEWAQAAFSIKRRSPRMARIFRPFCAGVLLTLLALGGAKFLYALFQGRANVLLLLQVMLFAIVLFSTLFLAASSETDLLSDSKPRKERYLESLQLAFSGLQKRRKSRRQQDERSLLLTLGVFGSSVFRRAPYVDFRVLMNRYEEEPVVEELDDEFMAETGSYFLTFLEDVVTEIVMESSNSDEDGMGCGGCGGGGGVGCGGCGSR